MSDESKNNSSKDICPTCRNATIRRVTRDYKVKFPDGQTSTVANLSFEECPECKDEFFSSEAMDRISDKVSAELDSLSLSDLKRIREKLQPNMTLLAESLGLGSKTWMRWENGEQNMSRSMGYFVRAMEQFPEVYEWVANRGWRRSQDAESLLEIAENIKEVASEYETSIYRFNRRRSGIQPEMKQNDEENILDSCS
jgi:putative zinc finger/helix-turn-helix YgiT family protein